MKEAENIRVLIVLTLMLWKGLHFENHCFQGIAFSGLSGPVHRAPRLSFPAPDMLLNLSLVCQCLRSGFLLGFLASNPHLTTQELANATKSNHMVNTHLTVPHFPFLQHVGPLSPSCIGNPEPPPCFPRPRRLLKCPIPRGKGAGQKASPFFLGSWSPKPWLLQSLSSAFKQLFYLAHSFWEECQSDRKSPLQLGMDITTVL